MVTQFVRYFIRAFALVVALTTLAATSAYAVAPTKKAKCKPGQTPVLTGKGKSAKVALSKGKVRCKTVPRPKASAVEPPAASSQGAIASTTDQLNQAFSVKPDALATTEKRIGKKATAALVDRAMTAWRKGVSAQARRLAEGDFHVDSKFGDPAKGTEGSVTINASKVDGDGKLGMQASGAVEFTADAKGLKELGADKVTDAKNAKVKIEVNFADVPDACPDASGKVKGKVTGEAKLTITTDGVSQTIAAKVEATYAITVGKDARWKTIDNVDVQTTFTFGGSKQGSETWRGRELGSGFGQQGLLDKGVDFGKGYDEASSHVDWNKGGIYGPHSRVDRATGPTAWDIKSISNLKGLVYTQVATHLMTLASVEYIRKIVADRVQKNWYDDEKCLKLDGKPAASKLKAGQSTKVTTSGGKAANGSPVDVDLAASGVAKLEPGTASMAAGATQDFTLTAPNTKPTVSTWKFVGTSVAGRKTINGTLADVEAFTVTLDDDETGDFATHKVTAKLTGSVKTSPVAQRPNESSGSGPVTWEAKTFISKQPPYNWLSEPRGEGTWTAVITDTGADEISVQLWFSEDAVLWFKHTNDEPPEPCSSGTCDPPPIHTQIQGAMPIAINVIGPFTMPATGGTKHLVNSVLDGGEGIYSDAMVTVTPGS